MSERKQLNDADPSVFHFHPDAPFQWVDGSVGVFTNWAMNEPNMPTTEFCVVVLNGKWYDISCPEMALVQGYVCNYKPGTYLDPWV